MRNRLKMHCKLRQEKDGTVVATISLYDGTPCELTVDRHDIITNESFAPDKTEMDGWLIVHQEAVQADRSYLTLPKPSIQFGHQVTVSAHSLLPVDVSLKDFNPQTR